MGFLNQRAVSEEEMKYRLTLKFSFQFYKRLILNCGIKLGNEVFILLFIG